MALAFPKLAIFYDLGGPFLAPKAVKLFKVNLKLIVNFRGAYFVLKFVSIFNNIVMHKVLELIDSLGGTEYILQKQRIGLLWLRLVVSDFVGLGVMDAVDSMAQSILHFN